VPASLSKIVVGRSGACFIAMRADWRAPSIVPSPRIGNAEPQSEIRSVVGAVTSFLKGLRGPPVASHPWPRCQARKKW